MDGSFFYISRNYLFKNINKLDFFRTEDTRYFLNTEDGNLGNLDIDDQNDLNFARSLSMN